MLTLKYWVVLVLAFLQYAEAQQSQVCPETGKDFLAHYSNCSRFFECHDGIKTLDSCPFNFTWSYEEKKCVFKDWGDHCWYTTLIPPTTTVPTTITADPNEGCKDWEFVYLPNYNDCHYYYECNYGTKTALKCPEGKAWSIPEDACILEVDADCSYITPGPTTVTPSPTECPSTGQSYLPDYGDCTAFYYCNNGTETYKHCYDGYAWNAELEACDLIENVDCSYTTLYPNQTTISTKPTTSTPTRPTTTPMSTPTAYTSPVVTTISPATTVPPDPLCEGQNNGAYVPHPYDCTKFIMCLDGKANVYNCPSGESWDQNEKKCDTNNEENCKNSTVIPTTTTSTTIFVTTTTPPTTTPPNNWCEGQKNGAYLPHPTDCTKFLLCVDEKATVLDCPDGESWDQSQKKCDNNTEENCKYLSTTPIPTTSWVDPICVGDDPTEPAYHPHHYNCSLFYECLNGTSLTLACESGYKWNAERSMCDVADRVDCSYTSPMPSSTTESAHTDVCKYEDDGTVFPHPANCQTFTLCLNNIGVTHMCPRYTFWEPAVQACTVKSENCEALYYYK